MTDHLTPIAIIGMSCRLPGDATDPERLWQACAEQRDLWQAFPNERLRDRVSYHPDHNRNGTSNAVGAHFLKEHPGFFDSAFFNVSDLEAKAMDPQQRILLEVSYEAFENAGISLTRLAKSDTSVFVGSSCSDYNRLLSRDPDRTELFQSTGTGQTMLSNRISYFYDLKGPSVTVDTACSSSLVALHLACSSLRAKESSMAVAGGSNLILEQSPAISLSMLGFLSSDGRCFSYDERANGFGRGEGISCLILKRLDDAIQSGDPVRAVILNSGTNQDGNTQGISLPSGDAQTELLEQNYNTAGLNPADTTYIEAHGTGTSAGDPIEARSISRIFTHNQRRSQPLLVGSIKSNIGHLEGGSGIASVLKVVMMLEKKTILPNYDFRNPNPQIPMQEWNLEVPDKVQPWPDTGKPRASIFNFGFGGSNAHVILEAPASRKINANLSNGWHEKDRQFIFLLSSSSASGGREQTKKLAQYLKERHEDHEANDLLGRLAFTLSERRSIFPWKAALTATSVSELISHLEDGQSEYQKKSTRQPMLAFVFTGQGAQWHAMGRELISAFPVFRQSLLTAQRCLGSFGATYKLLDELVESVESSRVNDVSLSQTLTTAVQVALVDLLKSWNIKPAAVIGHSSGEIAAAYCAGILSQESAMRVAHYRSIASLKLRSLRTGAMLAVGLSKEHVLPLLSGLTHGDADIACINSPQSTTVSGDECAIDHLALTLKEQGVFCRKLAVEVAYHSEHTRLVAEDYGASICDIEFTPQSDVPFFSSVSGRLIDAQSIVPRYWVDNFVSPVEFSAAFSSLVHNQGDSDLVILEIGPHAALQGPIRQIQTVPYYSMLQRNTSAISSSFKAICGILLAGVQVNLAAVNFPWGSTTVETLVDLPSYPWDHSHVHWAQSLQQNGPAERSDIIGVRLPDSTPLEPTWRNVVRVTEIPWVKDHVVQGKVLYPAAGFLAMAVEAISQKSSQQVFDEILLKEVSIDRALVIPHNVEAVETRISLRPNFRNLAKSWDEFSISSTVDGVQWIENCNGLITTRKRTPENGVDDDHEYHEEIYLPQHEAAFEDSIPVQTQELYQRLEKRGLKFGPTFTNPKSACVSGDRSHAEIKVPDTALSMPLSFEYPFTIHPVTLDGFLHAVFPLASGLGEDRETPVPTSIDSICISSQAEICPATTFDVYARRVEDEKYSLAAFNRSSPSVDPRVRIVGLAFTSLAYTEDDMNHRATDYRIAWTPDPTFTIVQHPGIAALMCPPVNHEMVEECTFYLAQRALSDLKIEEKQRFQPHHAKLYDDLSEWVGGGSSPHGIPSVALRLLWLDKSEEERANVISDISSSPLGILLSPIGNHLSGVLRGEDSALALMTEDDRLERFYAEYEQLKAVSNQIGYLVSLFGNRNPQLNILEVGAGTGGATLPIMQALSAQSDEVLNFANYHFTDVSAAFFEKARFKLEQWIDLIEFKLFDLEEDAAEQGFKTGSYDIIIAGNVIHATARIDQTLKRLKLLLRPGGRLILMETTRKSKALQLIFGTLPGWWSAQEPSRSKSPFLSESEWVDALVDVGFHGEKVIFRDTQDLLAHSTSAIVCENVVEGPPLPPVALVTVDHCSMSNRLKDLLTSAGIACEIKALSDFDPANRICVVLPSLGQSILKTPTSQEFDAIKKLLFSSRGALWVTDSSSPDAALATGFVRSARNEGGGSILVTFTLDGDNPLPVQLAAEKIYDVLRTAFSDPENAELEYIERQGGIMIPRMVEDHRFRDRNTATAELFKHDVQVPLRATIGTPGDLSSIVFEKLDWQDLKDNEVEVDVKATGLNFRDVMIALGQIPADGLGCECAGIVSSVGKSVSQLRTGDRVIVVPRDGGCYSNRLRVTPEEVDIIPEDMPFDIAASLPIIYLTAYWAVFQSARLQKDEGVLIHAASGGLGQALINICQMVGATIFATVGSAEKKALLMSEFSIPEDNILWSRGYGFAEGIMARTGHKGVDVVMNSLAGEALELSWSCLAPFGRFVELGKRDIAINSRLAMRNFRKNTTFTTLDASLEFSRLGSRHKPWQELMDWYRAGKIMPPVPITTHRISELELALRTMQSGKHVGKLVVVPREDETVICKPAATKRLFRRDASYLLIGGLGGIGRAILSWMFENGARNFILASQSGSEKPRSQEAVARLVQMGAKVIVFKCDVSNPTDVEKVLEASKEQMPAIRGMIHAALVLKSEMLSRMGVEAHIDVLKPKVNGVWNLHNQLSKTDLDFFIMLSSLAGLFGPASQSSYAAASVFQDAFAEFRNKQGLPAVSIDLGKVVDVGIIAEDSAARKSVEDTLTRALYKEDVFTAVRLAVEKPLQEIMLAGSTMVGIPPWTPEADPTLRSPMFCRYRRAAQVKSKTPTEREKAIASSSSVRTRVSEARTPAEGTEILYEALKYKCSSLLNISVEQFQPGNSLIDYGLDSLVAVELRKWLLREVDVAIPVLDLMGVGVSISELSQKLVRQITA